MNRHQISRSTRCGSRAPAIRAARGCAAATWLAIGTSALWLLGGPISAADLDCPDGTVARGEGLPAGFKRWCENAEGEQHGPSIAWYPDDTGKAIEAYFVNGRLEGDYRSWYPNGQLAEEVRYTNDLRDGTQRRWFDDGSPRSEQTFRAGIPDGRSVEWYPNGQVKFEESYANGKKNGPAVGYYQNGQKQAQGSFKNGAYDGTWTSWRPDGSVEKIAEFDRGVKLSETIPDDG